MGFAQKQSVIRTVGVIIWMSIGAVIGVVLFLAMAWEEAVRISNKDDE